MAFKATPRACRRGGGAGAVPRGGRGPAGSRHVVHAEWDFEGAGDYPVGGPRFDGSETRVSFETTCAFSEPGTYFPALRVVSQRQGDVDSPFARVQNLGRVRVVVS